MTLSLPWNSFEHMAGNSLMAIQTSKHEISSLDLYAAVRNLVSPQLVQPAPRLMVPVRSVRAVLNSGRHELQRRNEGVEESEEKGAQDAVDLTPIASL